jgi:hypothetical protein
MAPLNVCGKELTPEDRKAWQQAIAMLMGLKIRNGFDKRDLAAAVETALLRGAARRKCEDCGVKVGSGATNSGGPEGMERSPQPACLPWRFLNPAGPNLRTISLKSPT